MRYRVLTAFFRQRADADGALGRLLELGVPATSISVIAKHVARRDDLGLGVRTRVREGIALGGPLGGIVGVFAGAFAAGGALIAPDLGIVLAGPVVAALAVGGALAALGASVGAVAGLMSHTCEARYLEDAVAEGGTLVAVRCLGDGWPSIVDALARSGGVQVRLGKG